MKYFVLLSFFLRLSRNYVVWIIMTTDNANEDKENWFIAQLLQAQPWLANCGSLCWPRGLDLSKALGVATRGWSAMRYRQSYLKSSPQVVFLSQWFAEHHVLCNMVNKGDWVRRTCPQMPKKLKKPSMNLSLGTNSSHQSLSPWPQKEGGREGREVLPHPLPENRADLRPHTPWKVPFHQPLAPCAVLEGPSPWMPSASHCPCPMSLRS